MVIRANQNLRGHSAVRIEVIEALLNLLRHDITPMVPLRGTISASGDLMPLSYIAGTLIGDPNISVTVGSGYNRKVMSACDALKRFDIKPVELQPKEGLGLINGTALLPLWLAWSSTRRTNSRIRPHTGQAEAAHNIRSFLKSSDLVVGLETKKRTGQGLWQDRYSTRTAPQWIGPYLEDLMLAQRQVEVELNSTSDNPVIDIGTSSDHATGDVYSGGNFQATAITSAMDKTRTAIQMIGRMLFSQCSELINPATNNGLDPNLVFGDPDESYTMKGIDVNMGAYMSELAALAHPVSSHVQSAEMHNQGINSLAFLSGRRTMEAVDVLSHMCAAHLFVCCQAADLRDYHERFLSSVSVSGLLNENKMGLSNAQLAKLTTGLDELVRTWWNEANKLGHLQRCSVVASKFTGYVMDFIMHETIDAVSVKAIISVQDEFRQSMEAWFNDPSNNPKINHFNSADTHAAYLEGLGQGSAVLLDIVRGKLGLAFHQGLREEQRSTIGTSVSRIYEAIRQGVVVPALMPCLEGGNNSKYVEAGADTPVSSDASIGSVGVLGRV
ncbi:L-beta-phenylalanine forming phenylalanine aminomutase [Colletotrichum liriopes]|uniref:L-beta-phenylalanine forming phenylalanine aminomutase n=1 Tax=Colletotrichum liriopes TaxID=708192 RepID=A0AA37GIY7_9PEZI|nr:L-beta-phenylalanine forming phenylalanine aminomutase [Colletotrichum liriopes]